MVRRLLPLVLLFAALPGSEASGACLQGDLLYGTTSWKGRYEHICCDTPQRYAEHAGFLREPGIRFFDRLAEMAAQLKAGAAADDAKVAEEAGVAGPATGVYVQKNAATGAYEWIFYDSQCGQPLFVAPRGRSFEEWRRESENHGWPSFRDEEVVNGALLLREGGEVVSACPSPTHLGHQFQDARGARYCIDLLCIAGQREGGAAAGDLKTGAGAVAARRELQASATSASASPFWWTL